MAATSTTGATGTTTVTFTEVSSSNKLTAAYEDNKDGTGTVKLRNTNGEPITVTETGCKCVLSSSGIEKPVVEVHPIVKAATISLNSTAKPAPATVTVAWKACILESGSGNPSSSLNSDNVTVQFNKPVKVGQATVNYTEVYDTYLVTDISVDGGVLLFESVTKGYASVTPPATDMGALGTRKNVIIEMRDYCTDTPLKDVTVTVTGPNGYSYSETTTTTGRIVLGVLEPGNYKTSMTCSGYLDNAVDLLANDGFVV